MVVYGYVKDFRYAGDGTMQVQVRIPNVHGAYQLSDYNGKKVRNYTADENLPWYQSILLPHEPTEGEVVALTSLDKSSSTWLVIGLTGGSYNAGSTNI
jgi:hypothetical protein